MALVLAFGRHWLIYGRLFRPAIEQQSTRDEAQPADVILVLGAAEYRGRPSPVLRPAWIMRWNSTAALGRADHDHRRRGRRPGIHRGRGGTRLSDRPRRALGGHPGGGRGQKARWHSTALAGEIIDRMGLHSVIVVSDGYHIYRVKKMLQGSGA